MGAESSVCYIIFHYYLFFTLHLHSGTMFSSSISPPCTLLVFRCLWLYPSLHLYPLDHTAASGWSLCLQRLLQPFSPSCSQADHSRKQISCHSVLAASHCPQDSLHSVRWHMRCLPVSYLLLFILFLVVPAFFGSHSLPLQIDEKPHPVCSGVFRISCSLLSLLAELHAPAWT